MQSHTKKEWYEAAKTMQIKGRSYMNKSQLQKSVTYMIDVNNTRKNNRKSGGGAILSTPGKSDANRAPAPHPSYLSTPSFPLSTEEQGNLIVQFRQKMSKCSSPYDLKGFMLEHISSGILFPDHKSSESALVELINSGILTDNGQPREDNIQRAYLAGSFIVNQHVKAEEIGRMFLGTKLCFAASFYNIYKDQTKIIRAERRYDNVIHTYTCPSDTNEFKIAVKYIKEGDTQHINDYMRSNQIAMGVTRYKERGKYEETTHIYVEKDLYTLTRFKMPVVDFCIWEPQWNYNGNMEKALLNQLELHPHVVHHATNLNFAQRKANPN
jgi:hypothetical protein